MKQTNPAAHTLYHGGTEHQTLSDDQVFFSTSKRFSDGYGQVETYNVSFRNLFDTCNQEHINLLLSSVHSIYDAYEGTEYYTFEELNESNLLAHDDWELFEPHMPVIASMGFDGLRMFEGGNENYVTFKKEQYRLLTKEVAV